jgi:anthranilate phosphoribosyltransferase
MTTGVNYDRPLTAEAMTQTLGAIMRGETPPEEIRAFLEGLARRGETAEEIAAAVGVLRAHAVPLPLRDTRGLCDTCGTGGDGQGTINVSTLAALTAAAAGARVVKHGNRAASSRCGSADLLEGLGLRLDAEPARVAACVEQTGFGFCFAPTFHPAMKAVAPVRKALGIRTIFNLVGPLANPAPLTYQLVGVSELRLVRPMAEALARLKIRRGLVVHGADGLDEVSTAGPTQAVEVRDGTLTALTLSPDALGVPRATPEQVRGGEPSENVRIAREVLSGRPSPWADIVVANAGCALYVAERAPSPREGAAAARRALEQGHVNRLLDQVKEFYRHAG